MKPSCQRTVRLTVLTMSICAWAMVSARAETVLQTFSLVELLDKNWSRELVHFPLNPDAAKHAQNAMALVAPDGTACPFQVSTNGPAPEIAFLTDLPKGATQEYRLVEQAKTVAPVTDLSWEESPGTIRLRNSLIGLAVPTTAGAYSNGPVSAIQLRSGRWIGKSKLVSMRPIQSYRVRVTAQGPVYGEIEAEYGFGEQSKWTLRFRVIAGEPVIKVSERFDLGDSSKWELALDPGFAPTHGVSQVCEGPSIPKQWVHGYVVRPLSGKTTATPFNLHAWLPWWELENATAFSLFHLDGNVAIDQRLVDWKWKIRLTRSGQNPEPGPAGSVNGAELSLDEAIYGPAKAQLPAQQQAEATDVLFLAAGNGSVWAKEGEDGTKKGVPLQTTPAGGAVLQLQLAGPGREWLLGTSTIEQTLGTKRDAYIYLNKYCETPLQSVLDLQLDWGAKDNAAQHPRLFFGRPDLASVKEHYPEPMPSTSPGVKEAMWKFLFAPAPEVDLTYRNRFLKDLAGSVSRFTNPEPGYSSVNGPTHHVTQPIMDLVFKADVALSRDGMFTEAERKRINAQLAFLGCRIAAPDFYSNERNYRATANMTTMRYTTTLLLGCLLPTHPQAQTWVREGLAGVENIFANWIGPNGEWLESPHYQCVNGDLLCMLIAAQRAGLSDLVYDRRFLKSWLYLARISTPPDPGAAGFRHLPTVGHTYRNETTCLFSVMAKLWREKDPAAADELQWAWVQQGRPRWGLIGGTSLVNDFSEFMLADFEPQGPPAWGSMLFPNHGVVLRTGFPGPRETHLHLLQGSYVQHYDEDRGSVSFWGKGQPLSVDWGYNHDTASSAQLHSRLTIGGYWDTGKIAEYSAQHSADYLRTAQLAWNRQILFPKDESALGPNYFAICDSFAGIDKPTEWNLWLNTDKPLELDGTVVHMAGKGDVDLDIWFALDWAQRLPKQTAAELESLKSSQPADLALGGAEKMPATTSGADKQYVKTVSASVKVVKGLLTKQGWTTDILTQQALRFENVPAQASPVFCVLYPRLHTEVAPTFTPVADGHGVRIDSPVGTDYVFLAPTAIKYAKDAIQFDGTAGTIQIRGKVVTLTLGAAGTIRYGDTTLTDTKAASVRKGP